MGIKLKNPAKFVKMTATSEAEKNEHLNSFQKMFFTEIAIALIINLRNHPAIIFLSFTHYQTF